MNKGWRCLHFWPQLYNTVNWSCIELVVLSWIIRIYMIFASFYWLKSTCMCERDCLYHAISFILLWIVDKSIFWQRFKTKCCKHPLCLVCFDTLVMYLCSFPSCQMRTYQRLYYFKINVILKVILLQTNLTPKRKPFAAWEWIQYIYIYIKAAFYSLWITFPFGRPHKDV